MSSLYHQETRKQGITYRTLLAQEKCYDTKRHPLKFNPVDI